MINQRWQEITGLCLCCACGNRRSNGVFSLAGTLRAQFVSYNIWNLNYLASYGNYPDLSNIVHSLSWPWWANGRVAEKYMPSVCQAERRHCAETSCTATLHKTGHMDFPTGIHVLNPIAVIWFSN